MTDSTSDAFRWQAFFNNAAQPIFLLNRRRQVLFVNRAWETCTGMTLAEARGRACRRRSPTGSLEKDEAILAACAPPIDAVEGRTCQVRRRAPASANGWEIQFLPLAGADKMLGILGVIRVSEPPTKAPFTLPEKLMTLRDRQMACYRLDDIDTDIPSQARLREQARLAAQTRAPIALLGEAGVGKQWLARAIHNQGNERQRFFACLDAERLSPDLIGEVLLDPHKQRYDFGTIYLREPPRLPRELQSQLAEAIRFGENADFPRVIAGFRSDPRVELHAGRLLEKFYCAVSTVPITIPPLRERMPELPRLVEIFLQRAHSLLPHAVQGLAPEAMNALRSYQWPDNLRELLEVLRQACRRAKGDRIELADLPFYLKQGAMPAERHMPLDAILEKVEHRLITLALRLTQGNQTRAAELLEIWRPRLQRRLEKFTQAPE